MKMATPNPTIDSLFEQFVISNVDAPSNTPVIYHKRGVVNGEPYIGIATQRDLDELKQALEQYIASEVVKGKIDELKHTISFFDDEVRESDLVLKAFVNNRLAELKEKK